MSPSSKSSTVLIAQADLLESLQAQLRVGDSELVAVTDAEPLRALEIITTRKPDVVALERLFAATPRGAALMSRIKADPSLSHTEIRVVAYTAQAGGPQPVQSATPPPAESPEAAAAVASQPLDQTGTRRAQRFKIAGDREVMVDGNQARLVDLSIVGAQLISPTVLRPNQRVRVTLSDDQGTIRCAAVVAWASFEIPPKSGPRYRVGLEFFNADAAALDAFCARHAEG
jgi:hypothetical protein